MAIYHASVKVIKRSAGRSATAAAAYRAGENIYDRRTDEHFDYTKKTKVDYAEIIAPDDSPDWVHDRNELWNQVELNEKRKDAQCAREFVCALPQELSATENINLAREFAKREFVGSGMIADVCCHNLKSDNPHAHILLTMRNIDPNGFGNKNRDWNQKSALEGWRKNWGVHVNTELKKYGHKSRIDHRSLADQGIDRVPQIHHGNQPPRIARNNIIKNLNAANDDIQLEIMAEVVDLNEFRERKYGRDIAQQTVDRDIEQYQKQQAERDKKLGEMAEIYRLQAADYKQLINEEIKREQYRSKNDGGLNEGNNTESSKDSSKRDRKSNIDDRESAGPDREHDEVYTKLEELRQRIEKSREDTNSAIEQGRRSVLEQRDKQGNPGYQNPSEDKRQKGPEISR